ncbi:undecaprenyldiphospho-muramoylpentapeptide beta-N-acetylglucosaminyltransferase [Mangrovibacillus cuniculi]|uniref:UDP-N-acetylglucosamine--N-acetylmuramyl-(pentapeptide) pyrophosphoryl-undecaprenol N-acetylglucosamine transferase n=1 Tax=Mangrovibacillus cuniculi TaxID=2593652 RepID=A0A7S8HH80_9BACI|nr:undecaprenyldiphospho-muramoylpentapeptide beta-N-acetylglucosaminyltransferase [Mangrovibacillus cuniculi]QPC48381.1 undecaprenyldiphospho-muramoylpentapeptide beta-N-acetylglucosaminyltransferase [Mangrovibacillus cuniculi]
MKKQSIVFTGGGSAGHVSVNVALMPAFIKAGWEVAYIGSKNGIEREMITEQFPNVPYYPISSGKLRRYASWQNVTDPFRVLKGVGDALRVLRKRKPDVIFSKGGFVSVPVALAAKVSKTPMAIHESDVTPGLANKLAMPFANQIFTTFPETLSYTPKEKSTFVGAVIREELFKGDASHGRALAGLHNGKPILMMMGGSLGAKKLNEALRSQIDRLLEHFQIIHLCGKGNMHPELVKDGYKQYEFVTEELPHFLAATDFVISRAGSNSIFEFLALKKPMLLIPLSKQASRGDQILNANSFAKLGYAIVLEEENVTEATLFNELQALVSQSNEMKEKMGHSTSGMTIEQMKKKIEELI